MLLKFWGGNEERTRELSSHMANELTKNRGGINSVSKLISFDQIDEKPSAINTEM